MSWHTSLSSSWLVGDDDDSVVMVSPVKETKQGCDFADDNELVMVSPIHKDRTRNFISNKAATSYTEVSSAVAPIAIHTTIPSEQLSQGMDGVMETPPMKMNPSHQVQFWFTQPESGHCPETRANATSSHAVDTWETRTRIPQETVDSTSAMNSNLSQLPRVVADFLKVQKKEFRNLVRVAPIDELSPCSYSKNHKVAHVGGWQVVVEAGKFDVEELVIFFEVDCFIPEGVLSENVLKGQGRSMTSFQGKRGYHIKTHRHREVDSQGIIVAIHEIKAIEAIKVALFRHFKEYDLVRDEIGTYHFASFIGVTKVEVQQTENGQMIKLGKRPSFVPRTDFNRIQNCVNLFKKSKYKTLHWQESVKIDGTSMSVYFIPKSDERVFKLCNQLPQYPAPSGNVVLENGRFGICSREIELGEHPNNVYWQVALQLELPTKMAAADRSFVLQGELAGSSINGNREDYDEGKHEFLLYDVWDIKMNEYRSPDSVVDIAKALGLRHVPVVNHYATIPQLGKSYDDFYERARKTEHEGLVYKCFEQRLAFKVANPDWLVQHGE